MELFKLAKLNDCDGNIRQQWYVYYSYRHPETKQFVRFKKVISMKLLTRTARHASASEQIKKINKWLKEGNNPFDGDNYNTMLSEALDNYIKTIENKVRRRTLFSYRCFAEKLKKYLVENKIDTIKVSGFSSEMAKQYLDWIKNVNKLSNRTHNNVKEATSTIFKHFIERKYTDHNPFLGIPRLGEEEAELICLTPSELKVMKNKLPGENYPLYVIAMMVFYCFLRPQEIVRLKVEHIDLVHQRIRMGGKTTKNKKTQVIVIPDPLLEVLIKFKSMEVPSDYYIFSNRLYAGVNEIAPTRIAEAWHKWAVKNDIFKTIYHLKHTGVGMAIEAGINVRDLQLQLRHSSLDETQKYLEKFNNVASDRLKSGFPRF